MDFLHRVLEGSLPSDWGMLRTGALLMLQRDRLGWHRGINSHIIASSYVTGFFFSFYYKALKKGQNTTQKLIANLYLDYQRDIFLPFGGTGGVREFTLTQFFC